MRHSFLYLLSVACVAFLVSVMVSCKPALPSDVLSKGKMTDILYDYHVALAMAHSQDGGDRGESLAYREAVLKKHDVTSAEFDSSMVYYMRHTEMLEEVYKDLGDRLSNELVALGGNGGMSQFDNLTATGDTANVWNLSSSLVLSTQQPFNEYSFQMSVDSGYHKGDCLMLDFETQFIYQDGMRDGIALLAVEFKNDSVAQQVLHISGSQHYSVQVADNDTLGIKSVKGYFMLADGGFSSDMGSQSTLKLMFLDHIKLVRMHPQKVEAPKPSVSGDSARVDSASRVGMSSAPGGSMPSTSGGSMSSARPVAVPPPSSAPVKPVPGGSLPRPSLPKEGLKPAPVKMVQMK